MLDTQYYGAGIFENSEVEKLIAENKALCTTIKQTKEVAELIDAIGNINLNLIKSYVNEIETNFADEIKNIVLVGIGGSSLGTKAFLSTFQFLDRKCYFMENIDPVSIHETMRCVANRRSLFIFVSKSGNTIETLSQAEYIIDELKKINIDVSKQCITITAIDKPNDLSRLSGDNNIKIYPWHGNVGGRFSALTISTLLPLALMGVKLDEIAWAGKNIDNNIFNGLKGAVVNYLLWQKNYDVTVMMPYSDNLVDFSLWHRQLWAESIGKEGFGSIPTCATGTVDQHSMLQMYLGGKKNKFFTLIKTELELENYDIPERIMLKNSNIGINVDLQYSSQIGKKNIWFVSTLEAACDATFASLIEEGCPVRIITMPTIKNEKLYNNGGYIAKMMIEFFFETIFMTELANKYLGHKISAFGQPNVEKSKQNLINAINVL
jgi:glucose-6-phosphate isomerase